MNNSNLQGLSGQVATGQRRPVNRCRESFELPGIGAVGALIKPERVADAVHPQPISSVGIIAGIDLTHATIDLVAQVIGETELIKPRPGHVIFRAAKSVATRSKSAGLQPRRIVSGVIEGRDDLNDCREIAANDFEEKEAFIIISLPGCSGRL